MTQTDNHGREYARLSELKAGDLVQVDGDYFVCEDVQEIPSWAIMKVKACDDGTLYIDCLNEGEVKPYPLDICGDFSEGGDADDLVGIYRVEFGLKSLIKNPTFHASFADGTGVILAVGPALDIERSVSLARAAHKAYTDQPPPPLTAACFKDPSGRTLKEYAGPALNLIPRNGVSHEQDFQS